MLVTDFDFQLPSHLIAHYPLPQRSASRLMLLSRQDETIQHRQFNDLPQLLTERDLLIFNDTRVIPARLYGKKLSGGKLEILIERIINQHCALAHIRASKPLQPNSLFNVADGILVKMIERQDDLFLLEFQDSRSVLEILQQVGHMPLPPYIERQDESLDQDRYQTIYAKNLGAVAAPTAGLHFDEQLLQILKTKVDMDFVTLHVGAGTFQPVRVKNITDHVMHSEYCDVSATVVAKILKCKQKGGRVIAVGTTVARTLETAAQSGGIQSFQGQTKIFIYPPYFFKCIDALITNFHLPQSTLLMLVSAFASKDFILKAYQTAVSQQYRFFSYGDAMLIT